MSLPLLRPVNRLQIRPQRLRLVLREHAAVVPSAMVYALIPRYVAPRMGGAVLLKNIA
jgi:hypothetical protein